MIIIITKVGYFPIQTLSKAVSMSLFLSLAYLFFIGSVLGWVLELFFRRFISSANPERKWINPGFCVGPYVPLYGSGLCILYLLASLGDTWAFGATAAGRMLLFLCMAVSMTAIEYLVGILLLKCFKLRLWDYSMMRGNIRGLICPAFSLIWAAMGAVYYFFVHPRVLERPWSGSPTIWPFPSSSATSSASLPWT